MKLLLQCYLYVVGGISTTSRDVVAFHTKKENISKNLIKISLLLYSYELKYVFGLK